MCNTSINLTYIEGSCEWDLVEKEGNKLPSCNLVVNYKMTTIVEGNNLKHQLRQLYKQYTHNVVIMNNNYCQIKLYTTTVQVHVLDTNMHQR